MVVNITNISGNGHQDKQTKQYAKICEWATNCADQLTGVANIALLPVGNRV